MRFAILATVFLASCASKETTQSNGGAAPITHEPYGSEMKPFTVHNYNHIEWKSGPPSLPSGAQMSVLEGDPSKEGPFVFRLKVPDGYTIAPHTHPRAERVTVIQGTFNIAEGERVDKSNGKAKVMPAGSFGYWPARMHHYAWASDGETIIQLHGWGPWKIEYLTSSDDPRNGKK
jgi:hypothetical protein